MVSILTVNIGAAALPRAQALLGWLTTRDDADVIVLTETSDGPGTNYLLDRYRQAGWHVTHAERLGGERGTAIFSRLTTVDRPELTEGITPSGRAVAVTLGAPAAVTLLGIYVPSSDRAEGKIGRKRRFLETLLAALDALPATDARRLVVAGDYNVVSRDHQPPYRGFLDFEYALLDDLAARGLVDAHQRLHPDTQVHSWIGRTGNGYRFDYIHTSTTLTAAIRDCQYVHEPRTPGLTDHAAVTITLDLPAGAHRAVDPSVLTDTGTLF